MIEILSLIEQVLFYLLLVSFVFYIIRYKTNKSLLITISTVLVAEYFMLAIEDWIWLIKDKKALWFVWFNSFAWCEIIVAVCIFKLHQRDFIPFSFAARNVIYSYLVLATAQLIGYLDRAYLKTQVIIDIYQLLIPSIAISVMLVQTYAVGKDIYSAYKEKRGKLHAA